MPDLGRFFNVDPLSKKYAHQSHYSFAENKLTTYRELEGLEVYEEPYSPEEEEWRERGERESPLIRQGRFDPSDPSTYRGSNDEPLITPEGAQEKVNEIEDILLTGKKASQGFFERAIEWIGEQFTGNGDNNTDNVDSKKSVHGNSKESTNPQHTYDIQDTFSDDNDVVKTGISGGKINKNGTSRRANSQANKWNKNEGTPGRYKGVITGTIEGGEGARVKALDREKDNADLNRNTLDKEKHQRP